MSKAKMPDVHYKHGEPPFTSAPGLDFGDNHYFVFDRKKPEDPGYYPRYRKHGTKEYGSGYAMAHHGEGKKHGEK